MRRFAFILGIVLISSILVAAGFWLGYAQRFVTGFASVTVLDKSLTDASFRAILLHDLDSGHVDDARSLLRSQLDGDIITIWAFGDYSDPSSRRLATNVLTRIAVFRAQYPAIYTNRTSADGLDIDAKIADILAQAQKANAK